MTNCRAILIIALFGIGVCCAADPENIRDLCPTAPDAKKKPQTVFFNGLPCKSPSMITPSDFKSSKLASPGDTDNFHGSSVGIVTAADFAGLNTLGLSVGRMDLEFDGIVMPHSHPRASEMLFVSKGSVIAGFVDTKNQPFQEALKEGDVFVVPRGLLHYCFNIGYDSATILSVFNGQNPGSVSISDAMFGLNIPAPNVVNKLRSTLSLQKK
ncbi:germin-like protein subfamily 3 member 4 [Punica granatum]|uniref:Germin-like protein n=2 Tax=Punica granatum TaxID=22663 RepID=A0A218X260_PUNGR|nr:germin-like protein subfamily 3 member 4 [Punica granatum]OWM79285.1 hypothetical protein CDL15_Pgr003457 [Punica granatum]PKI50249.1 hypothetical protein CRG98_029322 [Punica granatum]